MEYNYYKKMKGIDVSPFIEEKKDLQYLSWANAVALVTDLYPDWSFKVYEYGENNAPYLYDPLLGYMVKTSVTIEGVTKEMYLPVMDANNNAMKDTEYSYKTKNGTRTVAPATMFDINKTIMRCLVKNIALFGLGLSLYTGEDLPDVDEMKEADKKALLNQNIKDLKAKAINLEGYSEFVKKQINGVGKPYKDFSSQDLQKLIEEILQKYPSLA